MIDKYLDAKFVFVVGIGGSDLAAKAVWRAMTLHCPTEKKLFFLESPDKREYEEMQNFINNTVAEPAEIVLIAISKSGQTTETLETFYKIFDMLSEKFGGQINDRVLVVTNSETPLWQLAQGRKFQILDWVGEVSGRFSAFTTPHLTVLALAGLDTKKFVMGGKTEAEASENENSEVKKLAEKIFEDHQKSGIEILDLFIFNSELEDLGKWCRQLIAESLSTFTPTVSIGPVDLHSMLELYLGGPKNRFTIFIKSQEEIAGDINDSAYIQVTEAYKKNRLSFSKYEMPKIDEYEIGKFMAFFMELTIELAVLLKTDPYDQPAVDHYKKSLRNL